MSITAAWSDGVFKPTGETKGAIPGKTYRVFSDEEVRDLTENAQWLKAAEPGFEFWNNNEDAVYGQL